MLELTGARITRVLGVADCMANLHFVRHLSPKLAKDFGGRELKQSGEKKPYTAAASFVNGTLNAQF